MGKEKRIGGSGGWYICQEHQSDTCIHADVITINSAQHTTLVDAQPDMALIVLAQDLKDRIYAAAHEAGLEPAAWLEAVLENLEGRKA